MKQLISLSVFMLILNATLAQKNRINITINDYSNFRVKLIENDTTDHYYNKGTIQIPSIGYYRTIKNNWGIGCEFGYKKQFTERLDTSTNTISKISTSITTTSIREIYFRPTLFQVYNWNKLQLTTSIAVPVQFQTRNEDYYKEIVKDKPTNTEYYNNSVMEVFPKQITLGIYCNVGFYRKLYKDLYCGPQLGFGIMQQRKYGNSFEKITFINNGIITEYNTTIQYKNYSNSRFDIRLAFSVYYNF